MIRLKAALALCLVLSLPACGGSEEPESARGAAVADLAAPMTGMPEAPAADTTAAVQMERHMQAMESASPDSLTAMLPEHRRIVANMIARMNREMRDMNMPADAQWSATVDSLRQDLRQMPDMAGAELKTLMPAHHARVARLAELHREMMAAMGM